MSPYKVQDPLNNAEEFLAAAKILEKNNIGFTNAPFLTCLAFSLELFLKALLRHYSPSKNIKGHDWNVLFYELPKNVQDNLFQRWCEVNPSMTPKQNFELWLMTEGNNFQEWRYHHEFYERDFNSSKTKSATMTFHPHKAYALIDAIRGLFIDIKMGKRVDENPEEKRNQSQ